MDPDEWVVVPDHGFLQTHDDGGSKFFCRKYGPDPKPVLHPEYFKTPRETADSQPPEDPRPTHEQVQSKQSSVKPLDPQLEKQVIEVKPPDTGGSVETDDDQVTVSSELSFDRTKEETQFADMKTVDGNTFHLDERSQAHQGPETQFADKQIEKEEGSDAEEEVEEKTDAGANNINIWKWSLTGIGAICTFGVAAATTVCVIFLGSQQKNKPHLQHNQKLRFQIYTGDKRIKRAVHHVSGLNEAIYAVRGVPLNRAHFTYGGHYDGV